MKTYAICPISNKRINERVVRFNGFFTVLLLLSFVLTSNVFLIVFLAVDFLFRSTNLPQYSLIAIVSKRIVKYLSLKELLINAGPKVFAARIGLVFSVAIVVLSLVGLDTAAIVLTAIFGICAFLETAIGFCVACEVYPFVYKLLYQSKIQLSKK